MTTNQSELATASSNSNQAAHLFAPFSLRGVTLPNRIVVSPMCQYSSTDGFATDWHLVHLGSRAAGGAGLIIAEATAVEARGRITPHDLGLYYDAHIEGLRRITDFIKAQGSIPAIQLAHAGRKASTRRPWDSGSPIVAPEEGGWTTVAPGELAFSPTYPQPTALTQAEIGEVITAFATAARRALLAGFQVIELHAAHGYLLHQFLSPVANRRTDKYGGSAENRQRLVLEVVAAIRQEWPAELPLLVRLSATDWLEQTNQESWQLTNSIQLAKLLGQNGVDLIDVSSGGISPDQQVKAGPGYQVPFAAAIRQEAGIPTAAVGLITEPTQADQIIRNSQADLIALGRVELRDPYWPRQAAQQLGLPPNWPPQYLRATT
jgi:2,4-dienoyl-CoA reductase-like NADH-dependent reductase (Old Yellow Enzyme family)